MSGRRDLWGGRFASGPAEVLRRFNDSWSFDRALLAYFHKRERLY